jgi:hypothetical protein
MAKVIATPCPCGVNMPVSRFQVIKDITDDLPADVIGECVTEAVHKAWCAGHDPALPPFVLLVHFQ